MYQSILLIDTGDNPDKVRPARLWLRNLYSVHQRLCMAFPKAERVSKDALFVHPFKPDDFDQVHIKRSLNSGFLFRIEPIESGRHVILVQSSVLPDWEYAFKNAGFLLAAKPEVKELNLVISENTKCFFRLVCNPVKRQYTPNGEKPGKRVPVKPETVSDWLTKLGKNKGFEVNELRVIQSGFITAYKKSAEKGLKFKFYRLEGVLTVSDSVKLRETLAAGIGSGRAFGMGLLSLFPER